MPRIWTHYDAIRLRRRVEKDLEGHWQDVVQQIQSHPETKRFGRADFPGAFGYVEGLYPRIAPVVSATILYKNENTAFCKRIGIPREAGGAFLTRASAILLCYCSLPDDAVLVHELLHLASRLLGSGFSSESVEEDFAYAKSIPYLKSRSYPDEWIRTSFLMPYYHGLELHDRAGRLGVQPRRLSLPDKEEARALATLKCQAMIERAMEDGDGEARTGADRFDLL